MSPIEKQIIIIGAGGFGTEIAWIAESCGWKVIGFLDDATLKHGTVEYGYPVFGAVRDACRYAEPDVHFHCAIGNNALRQKISTQIMELGFKPATLIFPNAVIAKGVDIGLGSYIGAGALLGPLSRIGNFTIVNSFANIGHQSVIGHYANVCPGASISGQCVIEDSVFIGSNATLLPRLVVGEGAVIGASSQATRHVKARSTVYGVPARTLIGSTSGDL